MSHVVPGSQSALAQSFGSCARVASSDDEFMLLVCVFR